MVTNNYLSLYAPSSVMRCVKCGKAAEEKSIAACKNCFVKIIEKRVRKEIRINRLFRKGDRVALIDDKSAEAKVSGFMIKSILGNLPMEFSVKKADYHLGKLSGGKSDKVIIPWCADLESEYLLSCVFENKNPEHLGHFMKGGKMYIKLLLPLIRREVEEFARIKGLRYYKKKKKSQAMKMLDTLETEYPDIKFGVLRSSRELKRSLDGK